MKSIAFVLLLLSASMHGQLLVPYEKDSLWGYCKRETKTVAIAPQYEYAAPFKDGRAVVQKNKRYFIIDRNNKIISTLPYTEVSFYYGLAAVKFRGKYGYIDYSGKFVVEPKYEWANRFEEVSQSTVRTKKHLLEIDREGNILKTKPLPSGDEINPSIGCPNYENRLL